MDELTKLYAAFAEEISHEYRFVLSPSSQEFLQKLLTEAEHKVIMLPVHSTLYRARPNGTPAGKNEAETSPLLPQEMKPIRNIVSEGRANPKNICVLYLATEIGTALAEVRPSTLHPVTIGTFSTQSELKIVDLTDQMSWHDYFFREDLIWHTLSSDFSKPLNELNQSVHYAKTQIIAETFKRHGYDGIRYRSQFYTREHLADTPASEGFNYALFDLASATCLSCKVYEIVQQHVVYKEVAS